eukprot:TRINITY_DN16730_c0_g3_i1.p1 TRINITY_DN16730_c0_g3~~TRINITY_DN16730_c0_g3_i1.p1  ORF type:complete len:443 (+),score=62.39 TRINITY_DN16730_c0_g3_i1:63-1391(+)
MTVANWKQVLVHAVVAQVLITVNMQFMYSRPHTLFEVSTPVSEPSAPLSVPVTPPSPTAPISTTGLPTTQPTAVPTSQPAAPQTTPPSIATPATPSNVLTYSQWMAKAGEDWLRQAEPRSRFADDSTPLARVTWEIGPVEQDKTLHLAHQGYTHKWEDERVVNNHSRNYVYCPKMMKIEQSFGATLDTFVESAAGRTIYFIGDSTSLLPFLRLINDALAQNRLPEDKVIDDNTCMPITIPPKTVTVCFSSAAGRDPPNIFKKVLNWAKAGDIVYFMHGTHYNAWAPEKPYDDEESEVLRSMPMFVPSDYERLYVNLRTDMQKVFRTIQEMRTKGMKVVMGTNPPQFFATKDGVCPVNPSDRGNCKTTNASLSIIREWTINTVLAENVLLVDEVADLSNAVRGIPEEAGSITSPGYDCTHLCVDVNIGLSHIISKAICNALAR